LPIADCSDKSANCNLESAIPKLTDFGLAKQLEDDSGNTRSGSILGSPSYMAPEQAAGHHREIGPAADVYALGAVFYECLTGRQAFKGATILDTLELVRVADPVPPCRLQPKLPRDLETICLKCLQKEPAKRYASALDLAEDLQRFLNDEPIRARPIGQAGRFWRWCRRNPRVAGLSAALLLAVLGGVAGVILLWRQAEIERGLAVEQRGRAEQLAEDARAQEELAKQQSLIAQTEANKARQVARFLTEMFQAPDPLGLEGVPLFAPRPEERLAQAAQPILDRGAESVRHGLQEQPEVRAELMDTIGRVYCTLGLPDRAEPLLEEALTLRRRLLPADAPEVADSLQNLAWLYHQKGDYPRAESCYREALARRRQSGADAMPISTTLFTLGWLLADQEDFEAAEALFQEAIDLRRGARGDGHRDVAVAQCGLVACRIARGDYQGAWGLYVQAAAVLFPADGDQSLVRSITLFQRALLSEYAAPQSTLLRQGTNRLAEQWLKESLALAKKVVGERHPFVALVLHELGLTLMEEKKNEEAEQCFRECLQVVKPYGLEHPKITLLLANYSLLLQRRGKTDKAEQLLAQALDRRQKRYGPKHPLVADCLVLQARLLDAQKQPARYEQLLRSALEMYRKGPRPSPSHFVVCLSWLAQWVARVQPAEAEQLWREALPLARKRYGPKDSEVVFELAGLAEALLAQHKYGEVAPVAREVLALAPQGDDGTRAWRCLSESHRALNQPDAVLAAATERRRLSGLRATDLVDVARELGRCSNLFQVGSAQRSACVGLALEILLEAKAKGLPNLRQLETDPAFATVRERPEFEKLFSDR
jgi:serine/threonine-protein kinase